MGQVSGRAFRFCPGWLVNTATKARLGSRLVDLNLISADQLRIALTEQKQSPMRLGDTLVKLGFLSESVLDRVINLSAGSEYIDLSTVSPDADALALVPRSVASRWPLLPVALHQDSKVLVVACSDPSNLCIHDQIRSLTGNSLDIQLKDASRSDILNHIGKFYGFLSSIDAVLQELETGRIRAGSADTDTSEENHPLIRLVDAILADAVSRCASDIHFEPEEKFLRIRYRIDGVLRQIRCLHSSYWPGMVVRLKVMSGMNIAESRLPQDGRFSHTCGGRRIDFRVACQPVLHGENLVLRILDREKGIVPLDALGLQQDVLSRLRAMLCRPEGLILVTGPTGCGKTTTLYSILDDLNTEAINIMTLEDPVEYPLPMVRQTNANESGMVGFATGIRSVLRQDPDIILVGEIRDADTATMACRAAMTGHQVYSTLHCNSALAAIPRLFDLGVPAHVLSGNIIGVVAQRLVRRLCPACRESNRHMDWEKASQASVREGMRESPGCAFCDCQGYQGRVAVMEVLVMDDQLDELILGRASQRAMRDLAASKGFVTMHDSARALVEAGITSTEEVIRVIGPPPCTSGGQ